jgi:hypothetical protein
MIHPLVVEDDPILAAVERRVCLRGEGIANPLHGPAPVCIGIDADHIESYRVIRKGRAGCEEHLGGQDELVLLVSVYCQRSAGERAGRSITHFDEHQAILIEHDEIDFAAAATVIARDLLQTPAFEVSARKLFGCSA